MERLIFGILRYSLLKFVYVIDQSCHPLVVHPLLRKILDPPLRRLCLHCSSPFPRRRWDAIYIEVFAIIY